VLRPYIAHFLLNLAPQIITGLSANFKKCQCLGKIFEILGTMLCDQDTLPVAQRFETAQALLQSLYNGVVNSADKHI
jgi:hypothetical protein